jgi:hypothetical protein
MKHCPLNMKRMDRPLFHFSMGFTSSYDHTVLHDRGGKYAGEKDPRRFFVFEDKAVRKTPAFRRPVAEGFVHRVAQLDAETVAGSNFYAETAWIWPEERSGLEGQDVRFVDGHTHSFPEVIAFFGTDFDDIYRLHGEVELWVEGKRYKFDRSFCAIVPEGVEHGPLTVRNVQRPIFHYTAGPARLYA